MAIRASRRLILILAGALMDIDDGTGVAISKV